MEANGSIHCTTALVLYGTETGNAQDLAEEVGRITERLHFSTRVVGLDNTSPPALSQYTITIFVVSTTGQGDFPSNAKSFWTSLLKRKLPHDFLKNVRFAVVGLGDSSYPKFNWAARKLGKRLNQLGAQEFIEACEADEQGDEGTDGTFLAWSQRLRTVLLQKYPLANGHQPIPDHVKLPSKWKLEHGPKSQAMNGHKARKSSHGSSVAPDHDRRPIDGSCAAVLQSNDRVTPIDHWQDVRLLRLTTEAPVEYMPGDALAVLPKNSAKDVESLISQMQWDKIADEPVKLVPTVSHIDQATHPPAPIDCPLQYPLLTLRSLLMEHLDITAIPRRSFFSSVSNYTNDATQKERLQEFADPQFLDEYFDYATRPRRSIIEILQEFDTVKIPWQEVISVFPILRPRQFSIASGGLLKRDPLGGTSFELLVAIVKYRTVIRKIREGVCTRYLAALPRGSTLNVVLRTEGRFHTRKELTSKSHLLIGAGTGIAPLRSLIFEKRALGKIVGNVPPTLLVFGARNENADFFFRDEWFRMETEEQEEAGAHSFSVVTAFSRDQKQKTYVQDRLRENASTVFDYICAREATIVVCGSSGQMPKAVREALVDILFFEGSKSALSHVPSTRADAEEYMTVMERKGRYKQETW